jgi:phosphoglycolate phosphatase
MIHTVIFDLGGTLVDFPDFFKRLAKEAPRDRTRIARVMHDEFERLYHRKRFSTVKDMLFTMVDNIGKQYDLGYLKKSILRIHRENYLKQAVLFNDSKAILAYLKDRGIKLMICSDGDSYIIRPQLKRLGIRKYFSKVFISSEIRSYKTMPKTARLVKPALSKPYGGILFVGDTLGDMETARRLGVRSVHIKRTSEAILAEHVIRRLTDLIPIVNASPSSQ